MHLRACGSKLTIPLPSRISGPPILRQGSIPMAITIIMNPAPGDGSISGRFIVISPSDENFRYSVTLTPRVRFSDRFAVTLSTTYEKNLNNHGWVKTNYDSLFNVITHFGRRDVSTISNILTVSYIFNTKASLSLRARHYWSKAKYLEFYTLNSNGTLAPCLRQAGGDYNQIHDINFNAFTVDLQFVWYFAPGSELSAVWKNIISTQDQAMADNYWNNLGNTLHSPQTNSF